MTYEDIVKALRDERFYDYDICQALKCGEFCENADCIFVQAADAIEALTARAERAEAEAQQHKRALEIVANIKAYTPNGTTLYVTSESIMDKEAALRFAVEAERDALKLKLISPKTAQKQI